MKKLFLFSFLKGLCFINIHDIQKKKQSNNVTLYIELLMINQWDGVTNITCSGGPICVSTGDQVLANLSMDKVSTTLLRQPWEFWCHLNF